MTLQEFQQSIREGIPAELPAPKAYEPEINHAPKRKDIQTKEEKKLHLKVRFFRSHFLGQFNISKSSFYIYMYSYVSSPF